MESEEEITRRRINLNCEIQMGKTAEFFFFLLSWTPIVAALFFFFYVSARTIFCAITFLMFERGNYIAFLQKVRENRKVNKELKNAKYHERS